MLDSRKAVENVVKYMMAHPYELGRFVRSGLGLRLGVPLAALRWVLQEMTQEMGLDASLDAEPPGLKFGATVEKMATKMRVGANVFVSRVQIDADQLRVELRIEDLSVKVLSQNKTQLSALLNSGALDLSKPGNLISELPDMPAMLVHAEGNKITLDLMKSEKFSDPRFRNMIGMLSSLITVHTVETEASEHIDVVLRALPRGSRAATQALNSTFIRPGLSRAQNIASKLLGRRSNSNDKKKLLRG